MKKYQSPTVKVVVFEVESGFLGSRNATSTEVNFGGSYETGIVTDEESTNKSGLTQYGYDNLFDRN